MRAYPEPDHCIVRLGSEGTPPNAYAHRVNGIYPMYLLKLKARMPGISLPKPISFPRLTLNIAWKPLKGFPEFFSCVRSHYLLRSALFSLVQIQSGPPWQA